MRGGPRLGVRPAVWGWQAIFIGGFVSAVAFVIGTTQFYQLAYAFLALLAAALVLGFAGSRNLTFSRALPPEARFVAGRPSRIDLRVSGGPRSGARVEVVDRLPEPQSFPASLPGTGYVPAVMEYGSGRLSRRREREEAGIRVPVTFPRRGLYHLGPAEVRLSDPLGFFRFVRTFAETEEVVVYPEVFPLPGFPLAGGSIEAGTRRSHGRRGDEFAGLREYRRGDDRRHIHWKSVARTGELFVKEFAVEAPRRYTVALDLCRRELRVPEREVEDAVCAAGSVISLLHEKDLPSRLLCAGGVVRTTKFGCTETSYWEAMRVLTTATMGAGEELEDVLDGEELGDGVILISRSRGGVGGLVERVRKLREAGLSVSVVAVASHTYRGHPAPGRREGEFAEHVRRLEGAGAAVRVLRHPEGVAGLAGAGLRRVI